MATADLHLHTYYSDGTDSPGRVIELAKQAGLSAISITDHDILDGYLEAIELAKAAGIELLPGLEMSASWNGQEVHILGFLFDPAHAAFQQRLSKQQERRIQRTHQMVARLQQIGVAITADEVFRVAGQGTVGRPHVAQVLLDRGYVKTLREAFDRYIGADGPAYIAGSPLNPKDAIQSIREAGGIPVLAHPVYLKEERVIEQFCRDGLLGLEVYHSSHSSEMIARYEQLADRLGLLRTGGTDYHGRSKEGAAIGSVTVPYELVERLKAWKRANAVRT